MGRALEARYAPRLEEHASELADHFAQSTDSADLAKAVEYGRLAAQRATTVHAYSEAARLLESTIEVQEVLDPDDRTTRFDLLLTLGENLGPAGEPLRAAEEIAPRAMQLAEAMADRERASQVCELAVEALHRHSGPRGVRTEVYREWAERWDRYAAPGTRARAYADCVLASVLRLEGRVADANTRVLRALELARQLDERELLFRVMASSLFPEGWPPAFQEEQRQIAYEVTTLPRQGVRNSTLALVLQRAQTMFLVAGDRDRAEQVWREMDQLAVHTKDVVLLLWPLQLEAIRATLDGDLEGAVSAAEQLIGRATELGIPMAGEVAAEALAFQPLFQLGRAEKALPITSRETRSRIDRGRPSYRIRVLVGLKRALEGRGADAAQELRQALSEIETGVAGGPAPTSALVSLLELAVALRDTETVIFVREQLHGVIAAVVRDMVVSNVARHLGSGAALLGEPEAARMELERSLEWATSIRHRPEIALTHLGLAELLLDSAPNEHGQAREHLDFAIEEFRAMKMQPSLERALRHKGLLHA